ncbi:hypothetical protein ACO0SA_002492 [Hanseniaspora valbyensis]
MGIQNVFINTVRKRTYNNENNIKKRGENNGSKETLNINFSNIFFRSYTFDDKDHPIYIFDSTYLPNMSKISNDKQLYDIILNKLIQKLIQKLPKNKKFSLIIFSSGFKNLNWKWTMSIKIYSKLINDINNYRLENDDKLIIHKMYIVHESLWVRTLFQIWQQFKTGQVLNEKEIELNGDDSFVMDEQNEMYQCVPSSTIFDTIYLNDLSELAQHVDISKLRISLNVYLYDLKINEYIELPSYYYNTMNTPNGIRLNRDFRQAMFEKIYERLSKESIENKLVFYKPGDKNKTKVMIDIISRNNYCDISQWDIYTLATVFIWFLSNKKKIFFPLEIIKSCKSFSEFVNNNSNFANIRLSFSITFKLYNKMMEYNCYYNLVKFIIPLFLNMIKHCGDTQHNYETVTEVLFTPLCKPAKESESYQTDKKLGKIFISNVLTHFDAIVEQYEKLESEKAKAIEQKNIEIEKNKKDLSELVHIESKPEARPIPHLANKNVSRQVSRTEDGSPITLKTSSKQAPKLPNPRKSSNVLSPAKDLETNEKLEYNSSPTKRQMGGATSKSEIKELGRLHIPFHLSDNLDGQNNSNVNSSFDSENDDTKFSIQPPLKIYGEDSRNTSDTLTDYSDNSSVKTPVKKIIPPLILTKPSELKSEKLPSPKRFFSDESDTCSYSNIVLSPVKSKDFASLKPSSRNVSNDILNQSNNTENKIINGHGNDDEVWEYVITKKENNKLIKDINSFKTFEMEISSKQKKKPNDFVGSIDPKLSKDRKVSNLIMLFEERSEGYNMIKKLNKK